MIAPPATPEALAALHRRCFRVPRPWSAAEFDSLLALPGTFLLIRPHGFLLGRIVLDEAELLTLAIAPGSRRRGLGRDLVADFATDARARGARTAFLEVAADNMPALALYAGLDWREAGRRPGYYEAGCDAVLMRLSLTEEKAPSANAMP